MIRAVFLDRDGVINQKAPEGDYITRWEDFRILPGVVEGVASLNRAGFSVIVITNQRCVAKGLITVAELEKMHQQMTDFLTRSGAVIDATFYCPHEMEPVCDCRKPAPGMLLSAARLHGIDLASSWMIGDSDIDIEAGKNAGCKTVRLLIREEATGELTSASGSASQPDFVAPSFLKAIQHILQLERTVADLSEKTPAAR